MSMNLIVIRKFLMRGNINNVSDYHQTTIVDSKNEKEETSLLS